MARTLCVVTLPTSSWQRIVLQFSDYELLKEKCDFYLQNQQSENMVIISGYASSADALGERYA